MRTRLLALETRLRGWASKAGILMPALALATAAGALLSAPALFFLALLWPAFRHALMDALEHATQERRAWRLLLWFGPVFAVAVAHPAPTDDLLRNLHAWMTHEDYRPLFWGSPGIQQGDYYLGFDVLVGAVDRVCRAAGFATWSWLPVVLSAVLGWSLVATWVLVPAPKALASSSGSSGSSGPSVCAAAAAFPASASAESAAQRLRDRAVWSVGVLGVFLLWLTPNFTARVLAGRPEIFLALWAFSALGVRTRRAAVLWVLCGMALAMSYWFFWIYLPAGALLWRDAAPTWKTWRARLLATALVLLFGVGFWVVATHGEFLSWFLHLRAAMRNRLVGVDEDRALVLGLMTPAVMGLFAALVWALALPRGAGPQDNGAQGGAPNALNAPNAPNALPRAFWWSLAAVVVWFALPNMTRYTDSVVSLGAAGVVLLLQERLRESRQALAPAAQQILLVSVFGALLWTLLVLGTQVRPLDAVTLPGAQPGQKVLTWFGPDTYDVLYLNPQVRVAPAFEVGFSTHAVQQASLDLTLGRVSCAFLAAHDVTWVVAPPSPIDAAQWGACLHLVKQTPSGSTLWKRGIAAPAS